jgi:muramoyltetrapeptide carboxypeptidase
MIRPSYLKKGDTVGIVAPAGNLRKPEIEPAVELIRSWGLEVRTGRYLFNRHHSFAGNDKQRAADLQEMLDSKDIQAIICARGGYGTVRIIDQLNFDGFLKNPKWLTGYSDITVLHAMLQQRLGVESIHGAMPRVIPPKEPDLLSFDSLRAMLFGEVKEYHIPTHKLNRKGIASGELVGGNLSVLYSIAGTAYDPDTEGKILFIEDLNESLYHIDRMMMNLQLRGKLEGLSSMIVGQMMDMKGSPSGFNKPAYQVIREAVERYDYPVMFAFPAGHDVPNLSLPMGRVVKINVGVGECGLVM